LFGSEIVGENGMNGLGQIKRWNSSEWKCLEDYGGVVRR